jgi:hypothetical protein
MLRGSPPFAGFSLQVMRLCVPNLQVFDPLCRKSPREFENIPIFWRTDAETRFDPTERGDLNGVVLISRAGFL